MGIASRVDRAEERVARAYAQRFERGIVVYTCQPGAQVPDRWFVLFAERQGIRLWSCFDPTLLGPETRAYRPGAYLPPCGCHLPAPGFGVVWLALKDLLGWALGPAETYHLAAAPSGSPDLYAPPVRLIGRNETRILLRADATWAVEAQAGVSYGA